MIFIGIVKFPPIFSKKKKPLQVELELEISVTEILWFMDAFSKALPYIGP